MVSCGSALTGGSLHAMRVRNDLNGCNRLELLNQSAAATAAATGSTGIAVVAHLDRSILNSVESQRCDVKRITGVVKNRHLEHLIEVTVVDRTVPTDADQIAAHHLIQCCAVEVAFEQFPVIFVLAA